MGDENVVSEKANVGSEMSNLKFGVIIIWIAFCNVYIGRELADLQHNLHKQVMLEHTINNQKLKFIVDILIPNPKE